MVTICVPSHKPLSWLLVTGGPRIPGDNTSPDEPDTNPFADIDTSDIGIPDADKLTDEEIENYFDIPRPVPEVNIPEGAFDDIDKMIKDAEATKDNTASN